MFSHHSFDIGTRHSLLYVRYRESYSVQTIHAHSDRKVFVIESGHVVVHEVLDLHAH